MDYDRLSRIQWLLLVLGGQGCRVKTLSTPEESGQILRLRNERQQLSHQEPRGRDNGVIVLECKSMKNKMNNTTRMDVIKTAIAAFISAILAYVEPVSNAMMLLIIAFVIDIFFGVICGVAVHNERFHFKKFILAATYLFIYLGIVAFVYTIGDYMGDEGGALFVVKTVTYLFIYFYSTNILKNLTLLFPNNRVFMALDYAVGLEFTKRMPWIDGFLKKENENKDENGNLQ
jgi:hypothetical protein